MSNKITIADQIWNEIKDKDINVFGFGGQKVSAYCAPLAIEPNRCFLLTKAPAVLPVLETLLGPAFLCEAVDKYIVISRK